MTLKLASVEAESQVRQRRRDDGRHRRKDRGEYDCGFARTINLQTLSQASSRSSAFLCYISSGDSTATSHSG